MTARRRVGLKPAKKLVVILLVAVVCLTTLRLGVRAFTTSRITDQIKVVGYYDVDYFRQMKECARDIADAGAAAKYFCNYYERGAGTSTRAENAVVALAWIQGD